MNAKTPANAAKILFIVSSPFLVLKAARLAARRYALVGQNLFQLARFEHLADDVAAADELALDVELRNGRPVGEILDALADRRIGQHVHALELHAEGGEDRADARREAALRENRRALHVEQHGIFGNLLLDAVGGGGGGIAHGNPLSWSYSIPRGRWSARRGRAAHCPCGIRARGRPSGAAAPGSCP